MAPPVKQKTLESFFAANSARTVVAADKPVVSVVASQVMDVGNRVVGLGRGRRGAD
jgi:hypothetical protein